jgi:hypothetical protein
VVEHRIARLVQLGIRQARYIGRTKTLFQVCLAAAVANLTLLAATSPTVSASVENAVGQLLMLLAAVLTLSRLLSACESHLFAIRHPVHDRAISAPLATIPPSRPAF